MATCIGIFQATLQARPYFKDFLKDSGNGAYFHSNQLSKNGFSYFMEKFSAPADVVLDPMMGNGGFLKVANGFNRKAIGIDIDADCVEIANSQLR